ncbi:hypothetical protein [Actinacidiphila sp. bgisy160]|uniref:hypothetical protein n=1 Tax=Actinacidiphila sp. bgisy160 TaxID=3413796 RepID=UPI003D719CA7
MTAGHARLHRDDAIVLEPRGPCPGVPVSGRRAAVERREHHPAAIVPDAARNKEVDAALDPARRRLGREVLRG